MPISREQWRLLPMEDQFDAVLYVGPPAAVTRSQLELIGMPQSELERVRQSCASIPAK
jgi:hypothetical protein